jgi:metal-sulfur cluster biosynthetic enzyme
MPTVQALRCALDRVRDPELDRSLVDLDFVRAVTVDGADVRVELRLPTYWCAPNFAFLMVSDARAAVASVPGVGGVEVELVEHFAGRQVSEAVAAGRSFPEAFPDQADGELTDLRQRFRRKAFLVRQEPLLRAAREALGDEGAAELRLGDARAPAWATPDDWREYLLRRREVGMPEERSSLVFTDAGGEPLAPDALGRYLRLSRSVRVSLLANAEFCTGLLAARYDASPEAWQRKEVAA